MANLQKWENIMKEKRMKTPFREFVKEICSWLPISFNKKNSLISRYPFDRRINKIIDSTNFAKNRDNLPYIDYQKNDNFFLNLGKLSDEVPFLNMIYFENNENSDFADVVSGSKNVYLSSNVVKGCENVAYSFSVKAGCTNVYNSFCVWNDSSNIYQSEGVIHSYNIYYSRFIDNCSHIYFSNNLIGCKNCIFCRGMENAEYCWNNNQLTKEEYIKKLNSFLTTYKKDYYKLYSKNTANGNNIGSTNVEGSFIHKSENVINGEIVFQVRNGHNLIAVGGKDVCENIYDCFACGSVSTNNVFGGVDSGWGDNIYCCNNVGTCSNVYYSHYLETCSFCIGCIGLKNKSYCILNKQYTKEEWEVLADKIFAQMDADGILGDFFPGELNPFYFNDTMAYLIDDSFTKEEVEKDGYLWRDEKIKVDIPDAAKVINIKDLDQYQGYDTNGNWQISDDILKKVIQDERGNFYKIVPMELEFLRKHALPLPELHWLDRIKMGFKM